MNCYSHVLRIFKFIFFPIFWVINNVLGNAIVFVFVADNVFVIIALPNRSRWGDWDWDWDWGVLQYARINIARINIARINIARIE